MMSMERPKGWTGRSPGWRGLAGAVACGLLLLVLPACGIPDLRPAQPAPPLPPTFNGASSAANSSLLSVEEFYQDPMLTGLIGQALADNRELRILNEDVRIAANEILGRSGAYLPFLTLGPTVGLDRASERTLEGAALKADPFLPGQFFSNPHGNYLVGLNFTWQLDIYRQLRNARDAAAQRYAAAIERRNAFVTRLTADIAEDYYRLMALDKRIENLNQIIALQERSREVAKARKEFARDTELAVLRFEAEVRRNQSDKLVVDQEIIEAENRINFALNRFPQRVGRNSPVFFDLENDRLGVGVPSQLLQNRPDVRQAERNLAAAGLDVKVARVNFYPQLVLNAGTGLQSFNIEGFFTPQAVVGNVAAGFVGPLVNRRAIRAEYLTSNARQLQAVYDYQRTVVNAFTEVVNRLTMVQNYSNSVAIKKQQLETLSSAVEVANTLFQFARVEYLDVLTAQRDLRDGRMELIDTKQQQLFAIANLYQALGGGVRPVPLGPGYAVGDVPGGPGPHTHTVRGGEDYRKISQFYYGSPRYHKALWAAARGTVPGRYRLRAGETILIPGVEQLDPALIEDDPARPAGDQPAATPPPPPVNAAGPFRPGATGGLADGPNAELLPAPPETAPAPPSGGQTAPAIPPMNGSP
jgi:NodT family efflux transporter outer membrane factor (OMF) lipoprotein